MNLNKNSIKKLVLIFLICAADILWSAGFIYLWKTKGVVLSVKEASVNIPGIFVQNLIVEAVPILLFFLFLFRLGKNFQTEMYLKITGKMQKCTVGILGGILLALALWCLVTKADKVTVLYNLLYYTVFIAFAEEFVVRGICVYLVRGEEPYIRYLAPNLLFAVMHLFFLCELGSDHSALCDIFRVVGAPGPSHHGLHFSVPERKIRNALDGGAGSCNPSTVNIK